MNSATYTVYILRCADGTLYTGVTTCLSRRVATHNAGKGAKYTRARLPVAAVYREPAACRADAQARERQIKRLSRQDKLRLIAAGTAVDADAGTPHTAPLGTPPYAEIAPRTGGPIAKR